MTNFNLTQAFTALNKKMGKPLPQHLSNHNTINLSELQYAILFLITMGKSLSEITEVIAKLNDRAYSRGTIQYVIQDQIYRKLGVYSNCELIEKAVIMGIINVTPPMFLN